MRKLLLALATLLCTVGTAFGYVSIGLQLNAYPTLVPVPGYPVMYAPGVHANYFYSDGLYWVYTDGGWYSSPWYDGPWDFVSADFVPYYILSVPVRYYALPPYYFRGWALDRPPRWDAQWGHAWAERRGWSHGGWDRPMTVAHNAAPAFPPANSAPAVQPHNAWTHPQQSFVPAQMPRHSWAPRPPAAGPAPNWTHSAAPAMTPAMRPPAARAAPNYGGRGQGNQRQHQDR